MKDIDLKPTRTIITALFSLLLVGSFVFYKERMLFVDAPHILFRIINDGKLFIVVKRYGSFITQLFPLVGVKLHFSLKGLMILYSISFNLFFTVIALLLLYKYKRYDIAILFGFYLTLFVSDSYFWTNNEIHQGIAWLLFAFAINFFSMAKQRPWFITVPLFIITFSLAIWTHPLVMLVALYLWFFYLLRGVNWPYSKAQTVMYSFLLIVLVLLKLYQSSNSWYDEGKIDSVKNFHLHNIITLYKLPQFHFFIKSCFTNYWLFSLIFISGLIALIKTKKYLLLALAIISTCGYFILVCITFADLSSLRFYIESEYAPLAIIGTAPFVYYLLPYLRSKWTIFILTIIFFIRVLYILHAAPTFTTRISLIKNINERMKEKNLTKLIIPDNDKSLDSLLVMNWGAPVESIMLSAMNGESPQRTFTFIDPDKVNDFSKTGKDTLIGCFEKRPFSKLNNRYFQIDTNATYQVMTFKSLIK